LLAARLLRITRSNGLLTSCPKTQGIYGSEVIKFDIRRSYKVNEELEPPGIIVLEINMMEELGNAGT
jgi:hypothetical protein